jgi:hypothetical protein
VRLKDRKGAFRKKLFGENAHNMHVRSAGFTQLHIQLSLRAILCVQKAQAQCVAMSETMRLALVNILEKGTLVKTAECKEPFGNREVHLADSAYSLARTIVVFQCEILPFGARVQAWHKLDSENETSQTRERGVSDEAG